MRTIQPKAILLRSEDRILICSDGYYEYAIDDQIARKRVRDIRNIMKSQEDIVDAVMELNQRAYADLTRIGAKPMDDYTVIAVQLQ